jgi:hypothetical protein
MSNKLTTEEFIERVKSIHKEKYLKSLGYNFVSIWESDYKKK